MNKLITAFLCFFVIQINAQEETETTAFEAESYPKTLDSINNSFTYQYGEVILNDGLAILNVPKGFKFLDGQQSKRVLTDLWGNPPSEPLGLLFPEAMTPMHDEFTYAVEIEYSDEGYIEDEDAEDLDYDDLLEEMQEDIKVDNPQRTAQGYPTMELVGWASPPYYDQDNKKLHWAKELKFEDYDVNTLNYNIRILGRNGFLNLNAIGDIDMLDAFNADRDNILHSVEFTAGNRYSDFNPDIDKVAAYGIGGLIAGKILAKAGFFAVILKFWKFIAIGAVALFSGFRKKLFGAGKEDA
ncbi:DUF2167 domain-containing protein [Algibacter amylolyticus]|uniref:DUF2167 domain-containing protein n=1 Tax=Algibacter amylolyticus TaxID=1608400 RepID=A0A5M7B298_9FLAO|nr:DUF2167 domain-containing protein [Algibacter amylolyticus]KAA5823559.1 DUF2167 domain-containing protein [Algibacter amylolyticus]MBB5267714.1 putative membrane-anchored protein [Algibacter amylolyticus]TSJ74047.1 DUF2167 domain-containing protein [Algibacter amylolyticus]